MNAKLKKNMQNLFEELASNFSLRNLNNCRCFGRIEIKTTFFYINISRFYSEFSKLKRNSNQGLSPQLPHVINLCRMLFKAKIQFVYISLFSYHHHRNDSVA